MRNVVVATIAVFLVFASKSNGQTLHIKHYTSRDGLAGNQVYMCHQDLNGYIWMATNSGLSRFDGNEFKTFTYKDGLSNNEILTVTNDNKNNIWATAFSARQSLFKISPDTVVKYTDSILSRDPQLTLHLVHQYYSQQRKITYISGREYILCIKDSIRPTLIHTGWEWRCRLFETEDGRVFTGDGTSIYELVDTALIFRKDLKLRKQYADVSYYDKNLYVAQNNKITIYRYNEGTFTYQKTITTSDDIDIISANKYGVWLTYMATKGCFLSEGVDFETSLKAIDIQGYLNRITIDSDEGMWFPTRDNGVYYIPNPELENYTENEGLVSSVLSSLIPVSDSGLLIGNNIGVVEQVNITDNSFKVLKRTDLAIKNGSKNTILNIQRHNDRYYILSDRKLAVLEHGNLNTIFDNILFKSVLFINDSLLSIGSVNYYITNLNSGSRLFKSNQLNRIYVQAKDTDGNLWLGGLTGLYRYFSEKKIIENIPVYDDARITALAVDEPYVWIGTQNHGLYIGKYDSGQVQILTKTAQGLPSNTINKIQVNNNIVWVATNKGVAFTKFNYENLKLNDFSLINHNDGLLSPEVNDIALWNNKLYAATYSGLAKLDIIPANDIEYKISNIYVKDLKTAQLYRDDSVKVRYSTNGIEIGFNVSTFKYRDEIIYKYKLEPFDNDWNTTVNTRVKYTNIPHGTYSFKIVAEDLHGNMSNDENVFHIEVIPLYWQTTSFKLLTFLAILTTVCLIIYSYYRYNKRQTNEKIAQHRLIAKTKLETLKAQIKPHFIFNSLNALKDYIFHRRTDTAIFLVQNFSHLVRKGLEFADTDFITISDEVAFLNQYLAFEKTKCDNCFEYIINVQNGIEDRYIPSLITQPFVENAVIHGVKGLSKNTGEIIINYRLENENIICEINDTGIGVNCSKHYKKNRKSGHNAKGTLLSKERIKYFKTGLGIEITLQITDLSEKDPAKHGTQVLIVISNAIKLEGL